MQLVGSNLLMWPHKQWLKNKKKLKEAPIVSYISHCRLWKVIVFILYIEERIITERVPCDLSRLYTES